MTLGLGSQKLQHGGIQLHFKVPFLPVQSAGDSPCYTQEDKCL